jgi:hypothetical protein
MDERRIAYVIGNGEYSEFQKLKMPAKDARDVAEALENLGFDVDCKINQTRGDILDMVDGAISKLKRGATCVVFYYAGHGCVVDGVEYLIPIDGRDMVNSSAAAHGFIGIEGLARMLNKSRTKVEVPIILIFDCCRIGIGQVGRAVGNSNESRAPTFGGLGEISNIIIMYSTIRGHQLSDGGTGNNNGPFVEYLLKYLGETMDVGELSRVVRSGLFKDDRFWHVQVVFTSDNLLEPFHFKPDESHHSNKRDLNVGLDKKINYS